MPHFMHSRLQLRALQEAHNPCCAVAMAYMHMQTFSFLAGFLQVRCPSCFQTVSGRYAECFTTSACCSDTGSVCWQCSRSLHDVLRCCGLYLLCLTLQHNLQYITTSSRPPSMFPADVPDSNACTEDCHTNSRLSLQFEVVLTLNIHPYPVGICQNVRGCFD